MFQKAFIALKKNNLLKKRSGLTSSSYDKGQTIGICINTNEPLPEFLDDFISTFRADGKSTYLVGVNSQRPKEPSRLDQVLTTNDFSFFGNVQSPEGLAFTSRGYDFLILLDKSRDYLLEHLAALCKARCTIGLGKRLNDELLDLQVSTDNPNELEDLMLYIRKIKSND